MDPQAEERNWSELFRRIGTLETQCAMIPDIKAMAKTNQDTLFGTNGRAEGGLVHQVYGLEKSERRRRQHQHGLWAGFITLVGALLSRFFDIFPWGKG